MNFGKKHVESKREELTSRSAMFGNTAGVTALRIGFALLLAFIVCAACLVLGTVRGIIDGTPDISEANIMPLGNASFIYDSEGNELQKLTGAEGNRVSISIDEIPLDMQHAIVAIEDERFYEHNGIDPSGILRAFIVGVGNGFHFTEGASTITQQLLKNNVFTDWMNETRLESFKRKLQEQYLALELEKELTAQGENAKDVILENYLNTINLGSGCYGVQTAAQTYFGKDAKDLTLSECAVLAAIPQAPTRYNPITHPENNATRREKVLRNMREQNYITDAEYQEALNDNVYDRIAMHTETKSVSNPYSYFIDEVITQLISDLMTQKGYTEVQAKNVVYSGGLKIYTTQDSYIQSVLDEEFQNEENFPSYVQYGLDWAMTVEQSDGTTQNYSKEMLQLYFRNQDPSFDLLFDSTEEAQSYVDQYKAAMVGEGDTIIGERINFILQPQASMTIIDQKTGYVKAIVGGRGEKTASLTLNRATDSYSQPGSTFKILATYGPALDLGKITLSTVIEDEAYNYENGQPVRNSDGRYHGDVTVREAIVHSYNIPAVKTLTELTPEAGFEYLSKLGFTRLNAADDAIQPLAIGGMHNGVSNLELTAAYACIANGGKYNTPIFYTKVTDSKGNVLIDNTNHTATQVFKSSTASLLTSVMEDVVKRGTGTACQIPNMHVAGKTGTTNEYKDLVFAGYTPYYTATIWTAYDSHAAFPESNREFHKKLWAKVMTRIHEGLPDVEFQLSSTVKEVTICTESGLLARSDCPSKTVEYYALADIPTERCKGHYVAPTLTPTPEATPTPTVDPTVTPTPVPTEDPSSGNGNESSGEEVTPDPSPDPGPSDDGVVPSAETEQ
ncbi:MAG: PBP1A family penicillin-binding protein [Fusicatenibacter sp.]|nr:PBP1A family penicillin-binding protein [Fusicatenibacter sp.]